MNDDIRSGLFPPVEKVNQPSEFAKRQEQKSGALLGTGFWDWQERQSEGRLVHLRAIFGTGI